LTAGSNIDHMTASHDIPQDRSYDRSHDMSHDIPHDHQEKIKKNMNGIHHCHDDEGLCPGFRVHI
jgi:hypothetical protein